MGDTPRDAPPHETVPVDLGAAVADNTSTYRVNGQARPWRRRLTLADVVAAETADPVPCAAGTAGREDRSAPRRGACDDTDRADGDRRDPRAERPAGRTPCVATSLNGRFVARASRGSTCVAPGDQVLVFEPIVGG